jgi:hypothetical protein
MTLVVLPTALPPSVVTFSAVSQPVAVITATITNNKIDLMEVSLFEDQGAGLDLGNIARCLGLGEFFLDLRDLYSSLDWDEDTRVLSLASSLGGLQEYPVFDREQLESVYAAEFSQASESAKGVGTMKQPRATGDGVLPRRPSPLFLSEEVLAAEVRARHQDLGHVNRLLFDPSRGRVVYALIQESAAPSEASLVVPWQALEMPATIDTDEIVFWLGLSAAELEDAPRLGEEGLESLEDPERVSAVHAFYGIPEFTPRACAERVD